MSAKRHEEALRKAALAYPEAKEDFPWGHTVFKVRGKIFLFLGAEEGFGLSVKLPTSNGMALMLPFASPTGYGLGKAGWVSAQFPPGKTPPIEMLLQWIDESYRAVAPKRLVAQLDAPAAGQRGGQGARPGGARRVPAKGRAPRRKNPGRG